jgi:hypothetical protein
MDTVFILQLTYMAIISGTTALDGYENITLVT